MSMPPRRRERVSRPISVLTLSADEALTAELDQEMSAAGGFGRTETLGDMAAALERLREPPAVDVVVLDRELPGMQGDDLQRISDASTASGIVLHPGRTRSAARPSPVSSAVVRAIHDGFDAEPDRSRFPGSPSPAQARRFVADLCERWSTAPVLDSVQLVATELVTNAQHHGRPPVSLHVDRLADAIRIDVHDASPVTPVLRSAPLLGPAGRGLLVVGAFAATWGTRRVLGGKSVWAVVTTGSEGGVAPPAR
jgi:hypothetical protein